MTPGAERYVEYCKARGGPFPHCDELVLHDPAICDVCGLDENKDLQRLRLELSINFTGSYLSDLEPSPAEQRRQVSTIEMWPGNRPQDDEDEYDYTVWLSEMFDLIGFDPDAV